MWLSTMISVGRSLVVLKRLERAFEHVQIVGVADARDVPAVADEARGHVFAEGQRRCALRW